MTQPRTLYQQSIQKMQQSIDRLENQLQRSKQFLSHDITVDNRTQKNINFTIKVSEDNDVNAFQSSLSKITIPHHSRIRQRIHTTPREYSHSRSPSSENRSKQKPKIRFTYNSSQESHSLDRNINNSLYTPSTPRQNYASTGRHQRKFQPFNKIQMDSPESIQFSQRRITQPIINHPFLSQTLQLSENKVPSSSYSESIEQEGRINDLQQFSHSTDLKQLVGDIMPLSLSQDKPQKGPILIQESPEVLNYLRQKQVPSHLQDYTPMHKQQQKHMTVTFSPDIFQNNNKTTEKRIMEEDSIGFQNNKKYFNDIKAKEPYKISKAQNRKSLLSERQSRNKQKQFSYLSKFQTHRKGKADDLFLQRKNMFLKNLQNSKQITTQKVNDRSKSKSLVQLQMTPQRKVSPNSTFRKHKQMSPRVKEISERLYSRSKQKSIPCKHYKRRSQSNERDSFYGLVHQNSFVRKYVTSQQQESLFQQFRRDQDSISSWPMKLLNYTYSKLKKINTNRYTIKKIPT